ncbi:MAG TPA: hypothetical protein VI029_16485 [Mycobacterium sp.]
MRDHDAIHGELRLIAGLRRPGHNRDEPTPVEASLDDLLDDLVDDLLDELLEQRNGGVSHPQARIDSCDLGPLCW